MATIKLQPSGKVVLKDGKVSCGCCFECLAYENYPPIELFNKFQFADLPSELTLAIPLKAAGGFFNESFLFTKPNSLEYVPPRSGSGPSAPVLFKTPTISFGEEEQEYDFITTFENSDEYLTLGWYLDDLGVSGYTEGRFTYNNQSDRNKLFWEPKNDALWNLSGAFVFDSFANSFVISGPAKSFSVSRGPRELSNIFPGSPPSYPSEQMALPTFFCNNPDIDGEPTEISANITYFSGNGAALYFDYVVALDISGSTIVSSSCKWKIKTPTGIFEKSGFQNTPVGSYAGGYTVS